LKMGNQGFEAALAAVEMANLKKAISHHPSENHKTAVGHQLSAVRKNRGWHNNRQGKTKQN